MPAFIEDFSSQTEGRTLLAGINTCKGDAGWRKIENLKDRQDNYTSTRFLLVRNDNETVPYGNLGSLEYIQ